VRAVKYLLVLLISIPAFALCDLCQKVDKQINNWDAANTLLLRQNAAKSSHALLQRLALGIHSGDLQFITPTVHLLGAIYQRDYDPMYTDLEMFMPDLKQDDVREAFYAELDKLPDLQKQNLMEALETLAHGHENDDQ
jgi:hypothetical protein